MLHRASAFSKYRDDYRECAIKLNGVGGIYNQTVKILIDRIALIN